VTGASAAKLVDASGNPVNNGDTVNLRYFKANDADGSIPEQTAGVGVVYTHPDGTASDSKAVKIHKIDFEVTDTEITAGVTQANESNVLVRLGSDPATSTIRVEPWVKIKLDPSCPRKQACAGNHRVGWLQTVWSNTRMVRYAYTLSSIVVPTPIRDNLPGNPPFPFYWLVKQFTRDNELHTAPHEDSPSQPCPWTDGRLDQQAKDHPSWPDILSHALKRVSFRDEFTSWLVVQNIEWSGHDLPGSFAYQKNFDWSIRLSVDVDTTKPVGSRCKPHSSVPDIEPMSDGKGSREPNLAAPTANGSQTVTSEKAELYDAED